MSMVAALYVEKGGAYFGLEDVDPWDEERDARLYAGPWPVVAHPPCAAWSRYAEAREACWGKPAFEDGGCFAHALATVREFGGVLEHPAHSRAWERFGLPEPSVFGYWSQTVYGEWVAAMSQGHYGHRIDKATWLLYVGETPPEPLRVGRLPDGLRTVDGVTSAWRNPTPPEFAEYLIGLARRAAVSPSAALRL